MTEVKIKKLCQIMGITRRQYGAWCKKEREFSKKLAKDMLAFALQPTLVRQKGFASMRNE